MKYSSVDSYIDTLPGEIQALVNKIRKEILMAAPGAEECISYGMPAYRLGGKPLVYFAAFKNHIGFYATPAAHKQFKKELSKYKQGKGSVQFPISNPIPLSLIRSIVIFRAQENLAKAKQ